MPVLAFALGMFIPLSLNTPLLVGGAISALVKNKEKGTLIASGFIAGGALMGVVAAVIKFCGVECFMDEWFASSGSAIVAIVAYVAIIAYMIISSNKKEK